MSHPNVSLAPLPPLTTPEVRDAFDAYLAELATITGEATRSTATYPWRDAYRPEGHVSNGRAAWAMRVGGALAGFVLVRTPASTGEPWYELAEIWTAPAHRGSGLTRAAMGEVFARHPGPWRVAVHEANARSNAFFAGAARRHSHGPSATWTSGSRRWRAFTIADADPRTVALGRRLSRLVALRGGLDRALDAVASLDLRDGAIGAGAVRAAVWDARFAGAATGRAGDVDVVWCDPSADPGEDARIRKALARRLPDLDWDVTNQAHVHRWYEPPGAPLRTSTEGIATWPETATAVAIGAADRRVIAPLGLDDLFAGVVRHNPVRCGADAWRARCAAKQFTARWPGVHVVTG